MLRSWRIGRISGIDLYIHWTFLLLPAFFFVENLDSGLQIALLYMTVILAIFGCVVLHELGHAFMARVFGISTRDITLYPIGGVARLEECGDDREAFLGVDAQETPEALGKDVGVAVADADLEAKDQARALGTDGRERQGRRAPHVSRGIGHRVDQQGQAARAFGPRSARY